MVRAMNVPDELRYSKDHEWARLDGGRVRIGITDYAVKQLADLVHIDLPKVGDSVEQGAPFGEIESVKTVADLITPLTGKIIERQRDRTSRETKYVVQGTTLEGVAAEVVAKVGAGGKLFVITVYLC